MWCGVPVSLVASASMHPMCDVCRVCELADECEHVVSVRCVSCLGTCWLRSWLTCVVRDSPVSFPETTHVVNGAYVSPLVSVSTQFLCDVCWVCELASVSLRSCVLTHVVCVGLQVGS